MKKGITLSVLSVVILIMVIFATAVTTTGSMALNNSKKIKFASELALVQEKVNEYTNNKEGKYPISNKVELDLSKVTTNSITQFDGEVKNGTSITLYEIDFSLLGKIELIYGTKEDEDSTDIYAVSKETGKVYYIKGVKVSKITYYTLTDELKENIGYTENVTSNAKDGIIFEPITTEWTNQNIDSQVKVPNSSDYTDVTIYILQNGEKVKTLNISESTTDYNIYNINNITGNYDVQVEYYKYSNYSKQNFNVTNFDNVSPVIDVKETKDMVNDNDGINQTYINLEVTDNLSEIKFTKYEMENIAHENAKKYFTSNGLNVYNNTIVISGSIQYVTIYVEDMAGNYTVQTVNITTINDYTKNGLVLHYDGINNTGNGHDNSATVWKDLSSSGNDATLNTDNSFDNNSCVFQKTNNSGISITNPLKYGVNSGFTIECIAKSNTVDISDLENNNLRDWFWEIKNDDSNFMQFVRSSFGVYNMNVLLDNSKYFYDSIAQNGIVISQLVVNNSKITHYYDGNLTSEKSSTNEILNTLLSINSIDLGYAHWNNNSILNLNGNIYSFRVYNRALTEEEIKQNYRVDKIRFGI